MSEALAGPNPYVGPRPLRFGESLFGRSKEVPGLFYLLNADRIVLLHSPSGAGKSSLVQAGLLPRLKQENFDVWPTIRVNLEPPANGGANRYLLSTILSLEEELPETLRRGASVLAGMSLEEYVAGRPRKRSASSSTLLVFDQFEEILTIDPLAIDTKREFFTQLGTVLHRREIWALFIIREDYLAPLDPYAPLIPTQLTNRFRLDLLDLDASIESIKNPARAAGREFAPGVAEQLVRDLASMSVQQPDGSFVKQSGHNVEPVQLQVVCRRLWDEMPPNDLTIDLDDLKRFGDVNHALGAYYDLSVERVAAGSRSRERGIREWFSEKLITRSEIRGQVLQGAEKTEGLDNQVIYRLLDTHLIRAEKRRGATWYELAHDRLIEPVSRSNRKWFETNLEDFQQRASVWEKSGHPEGVLLVGADLEKADSWVKKHPAIPLTDIEERFLKESHREQEAVEATRRQARRIRGLAIVSAIGGVIAIVVAGIAVWQYSALKHAQSAASLAEMQGHIAQMQSVEAEKDALSARQARDKIFQDLLASVFLIPEMLPPGSAPGEVKSLDPAWLALVSADSKSFAIARTFGPDSRGRVLALGHDGFLAYRDPFGNNIFLRIALAWLKGAKSHSVLLSAKPTDAFVLYSGRKGLDALGGLLRQWQYDVTETTDLSDRNQLQKAGVLIIGNAWGELKKPEMAAIEKFVQDGGGLLGVGIGWSWQGYGPNGRDNGPNRSKLEDYPMNQLFAKFGAHWTEQTIQIPH